MNRRVSTEIVGGMAKWVEMGKIFPLFSSRYQASFTLEFFLGPLHWKRLNVIPVTQR
jgi:hypothetical protein